jgi:predicted ATPase/class 3 adenylate cyclase
MRDLPSGTVTLLFTDIEGSTQLLNQLGDRYSFMLTECRQLLRTAFQQWNGHEVDTQGDAFFVAFARATDAVRAAMEMQRALTLHAWPNDVTVRVRMGLHTGEPQLFAEGYVGLDVHRAARIMSAGHGGQVLLSQTTRDLVEHDLPDGVSLRDLGAHRLKDLQHPSHLFQLVVAGLPTAFPALKTLDTHPHNLPVQPTSLIGREQELAAVQHLLGHEDVRLLTLTGPGGIGKTRLGLQVAAELTDHFPDGVYFVNLAPLSDPALVMPTLAQTLDLKETAEQPLLDRLKDYLRDKQLLLLLDNFEQVVSAAPQVTELLAAFPKLKVVVTSRVVLHVRGEQEFAVPPLAVPDPKDVLDLAVLSQYEAVALFISRAQAIKPGFQVSTANAPAVAAICARLDGLPLAIELAAARIKLLPPQALLARLSQRLAVLTSVARDVPLRQLTLRNTIQWSYDLLSAEEQRLFRRFSVFVGGGQLSAIEAVWVARLGQELDNLRAALEWALEEVTEEQAQERRGLALRLSTALEPFWVMRGPYSEARIFLERALAQSEWESASLRVRVLQATASIVFLQGDFDRLNVLAQQSLALYRELGDRRGIANALSLLAEVAEANGKAADALALSEEQVRLMRQIGEPGEVAYALFNVAGNFSLLGEYARGQAFFEEALLLFRKAGNELMVGATLAWSAFYLLWSASGDVATVRQRLQQGQALISRVGDRKWMAHSSLVAALIALAEGETVRAYDLAQESLAIYQEMGHRRYIAMTLYVLGRVEAQRSDQKAARSRYMESLAFAQELGDTWMILFHLEGLASVRAQLGEQAFAAAWQEGRSMKLEQVINDVLKRGDEAGKQ